MKNFCINSLYIVKFSQCMQARRLGRMLFWGGAGTAEDIEREEMDDGVIERGGRLPCGVWVEILSPRYCKNSVAVVLTT
jgi:hypothetical protein